MNQADAVRGGQSHGHLGEDSGQGLGTQRPDLDHLGEGHAVHELEDEVTAPTVLPGLVERHHVGVAQQRERLYFALEPCDIMGWGRRVEHLDRDRSTGGELPSAVDPAHGAGAEEALKDEAGDLEGSAKRFRHPFSLTRTLTTRR